MGTCVDTRKGGNGGTKDNVGSARVWKQGGVAAAGGGQVGEVEKWGGGEPGQGGEGGEVLLPVASRFVFVFLLQFEATFGSSNTLGSSYFLGHQSS